MLALNNTPQGGELLLPGLRLSQEETRQRSTHFDLTLSLQEEGEELRGSLEYARDLFDRSTMERLAGQLDRGLWGVVADAGQRGNKLPLLSEGERQAGGEEFNRTAAAYPGEKLIQELFEEQVEKTPDAVAVVFEDEELSYAQLNRRANQLAHFLMEQGIEPDERVAICVERSLEMVVGLLGI